MLKNISNTYINKYFSLLDSYQHFIFSNFLLISPFYHFETFFQVLIGDKEIDETSDLSDIASDYGEPEIVPGTQSVLIESKTIIGGKNPLHSGSDGESSADSGVKEVDRDRSGYDEPDFVTKTDITVDDDSKKLISIISS